MEEKLCDLPQTSALWKHKKNGLQRWMESSTSISSMYLIELKEPHFDIRLSRFEIWGPLDRQGIDGRTLGECVSWIEECPRGHGTRIAAQWEGDWSQLPGRGAGMWFIWKYAERAVDH